jgi:hypothetical protein
VAGHKPTSILTVDSTKSDPPRCSDLEDILFGTATDDARLPTPDEVIALFTGGEVDVDLGLAANQPTFVAGTGVITLPAVPGVQWKVGRRQQGPGAQPALTSGQTATVRATATSGTTTWSATIDLDVRAAVAAKMCTGRDSQVRVAGSQHKILTLRDRVDVEIRNRTTVHSEAERTRECSSSQLEPPTSTTKAQTSSVHSRRS